MELKYLITHLSERYITWVFLASLFIVPLLVIFVRNYRAKRAARLTTRLKARKRLTNKESLFSDLGYWFSQVYLPSPASLIITGVFALICILLGHFWEIIPKSDANQFQNLIAVHAGIGTIIFALIIFVAESLRDDDGKDRARVLLKESFLFPLAISEVFVFFGFLWGEVNYFILLPIALVGFSAIISLYRLLSVLLNKRRFFLKRLQLLKDRIRKSINSAIDQRLGNSVLLESLGEGKTELTYFPGGVLDDDDEHHIYFNTPKSGTITDVHLDILDRIAKRIEEISNKKDLSFYEEKAKPLSLAEQATVSDEVKVTKKEKYRHDRTRYLLYKFKDKIEEEDRRILALPKGLLSLEEVAEINLLAKQVFEVTKSEDTFSEEILTELGGVKDQFLRAIDEGQIGKVQDLIKIYLALADVFLDLLNQYGGGYSYEQAKKERSNLWDEWGEIRWLNDSVREVIVRAVSAGNISILREVATLPIGIAIRAVKNKDHYLFQTFSRFASFLYYLSQNTTGISDEVKEFLIEKAHSHPNDLSEYFIQNKLRDTKSVEELKQYKDFAVSILFLFLDLLKLAYEKRDTGSFKIFCSAVAALYKRFTEQEYPRAEHIKLDLDGAAPEKKQELQKQYDLKVAREAIADEISEKKQELFFGLTAWIFKKHFANKTDAIIKSFYDELQQRLPKEVKELTKIFVNTHDYDTAGFWGWDTWDLVADGEVHTIDSNGPVEKLFAIAALKLLRNKTEAEANAFKLPPSRTLAFLAEENSSLVKFLDGITASPTNWEGILDATEIAAIPFLKSLLAEVKTAQELIEDQILATSKITEGKKEKFYEKFYEAFEKNVTLRKIAQKAKIIENRTKGPDVEGPKVRLLGYNQLDDKAAFLEKWHVSYSRWGENYGEGVARGEDQEVFQEIVDGLKTKVTANKEYILEKIEKLMEGKNPSDFVALGFSNLMLEYDRVKKSENFISRWRRDHELTGYEDIDAYLGYLKLQNGKLPIIRVFLRDLELRETFCVVSLSKFAKWLQLPPYEDPKNKKNVRSIFAFSIADLGHDDEARNDLLTKKPQWLQEQADPEFYLRQRVLIKIYEKLKLEILDSEAGFSISINEAGNSDKSTGEQ